MENKFCIKCGAPLVPNSVFCGQCGARQDQYAEPVQQQYQPYQQYQSYQPYQQNTYDPYAPKPLSVKSKVFGGIGLGLSIFGFIWAIICFMLAVSATYFTSYLGLIYSICFIITSILGMVFANIARNDGNYSGLTTAGKGLGIAGMVIFILNIVVSISFAA